MIDLKKLSANPNGGNMTNECLRNMKWSLSPLEALESKICLFDRHCPHFQQLYYATVNGMSLDMILKAKRVIFSWNQKQKVI